MPERDEIRPPWPAWSGFAALGLTLLVVGLADVLFIGVLKAAGVGFNSDSPGLTLTLTLVQDLALVASALVLAARIGRPRPEYFGIRRVPWRRALKWGLIAFAIYFVFQLLYVAAVNPHEKQTTLKDLGAGHGTAVTVLIGMLVVGVAPPIEEFFFRGFLYGSLRTRFSFVPAAVIAGVVFGAVHAQTGIQAVPPLVALGFALCVSFEATGSILPGVCIHALNNMVAFGVDKQGSWAVGAVVAAVVVTACVTVPAPLRTLK